MSKINKEDKKNINDFLQCNIGKEAILEIVKNKKIKNEFKLLDDLIKNGVNKGYFFSINKRKINQNCLIKAIIYKTLFLAPGIERPKQIKKIFHYTLFKNKDDIVESGLITSKFGSSRNDYKETKLLANKILNNVNKNIFYRVEGTINNFKYNSFSYNELDEKALQMLFSCNKTTKFSVKIVNYVEIIDQMDVDSIYHGFVRYGLNEKNEMIKFLNLVLKHVYKNVYYYKTIINELIAIACIFVKDSNFEDEKEYRVALKAPKMELKIDSRIFSWD